MTKLLALDHEIYQSFVIRCANDGWLRKPPQYRSDLECEQERVMDAERDIQATRWWFQYRANFTLTPTQIVAAQILEDES